MVGSDLQERYRIIRRLGAGTMGEVFLAEHLHLGRYEALKVLRTPSRQAPELAARFRREARAMNRFAHPNIVRVHDFGQQEDGRFYLAMEYAEGTSMDKFLRQQRKLPLVRALYLLAKIADAVEHAHSHSVIHRDLKPSNVVLTTQEKSFEEPKVLDFGLAKIVSPDYNDSVRGTAGRALGTPFYMAPELIANRPFDKRIDIYSLGCLAFELLSGQPPFVGPVMQICQAHIAEPPPRVRDRHPRTAIPAEIDDVLQGCLQKHPDQRIQTAGAVARAFRRAAEELLPGAEPARSRGASRQSTSLQTTRPMPATRTTLKWKAQPARFGNVLADLARAILDQGCRDARLIVAYASLSEAESEVSRYRSEIETLRTRRVIFEQYFREREDSLRFALSELRFLLSRHEYPAGALGQIQQATASLEQRLEELRARAEKELAWISDAENEEQSRLRRARESRRQQRSETYAIIESLMPYYGELGVVNHLWRQLAGWGKESA